jgi:cytochrome c oxidase subunit 2
MGNRFRSIIQIRFIATAVLGGLLLIGALTGCDMSGRQSTFLTEGPVARHQLYLFYITVWVSVFIFLVVGGFLAYAQIKFRVKKGYEDDDIPPPQTHGHPLVEMGLICVSVLLLVIIAIPTVRGIWYVADTPEGEEALVVTVTGYQWWFKFEYPELGIVTANELVIPKDRPIHLDLRTLDVIHSFWVPRLAGKVDMMPNRANHMWLQADNEGYYWGQCAEFCGESHANMRFRVVSLDNGDFEAWVQRQAQEARDVSSADTAMTWSNLNPEIQFASLEGTEETELEVDSLEGWRRQQFLIGEEESEVINQGRTLFREKACVMCHTIRGHGAPGIVGPDLTHFGSRTTLAAGLLENSPENLAAWISDPESLKPGNIMHRDGYVVNQTELSNEDVKALVAYLNSLK